MVITEHVGNGIVAFIHQNEESGITEYTTFQLSKVCMAVKVAIYSPK